MSHDHNQVVVIDNGSGSIKAGLSGENQPKASFRSVVGQPLRIPSGGLVMDVSLPHKPPQQEGEALTSSCSNGSHDSFSGGAYYGDCAFDHLDQVCMKYPIRYGQVCDWDNMERLWAHTLLREVGIAPQDRPLLLTEAMGEYQRNKEQTMQTMFESFNVPLLCLAKQAVLSLYASGTTTGCVVESGYETTQVVPICEGRVMPSNITIKLGGKDVTSYLTQLLHDSATTFSSCCGSNNSKTNGSAHPPSSLPQYVVAKIKEQTAYVSSDYQAEVHQCPTGCNGNSSQHFTLPDGQVLTLGQERFRCTEVLFQPYAFQKPFFCYSYSADQGHMLGLSEVVDRAILGIADKAMQKQLYGNIVLSGGNTMFAGMSQRLESDLIQRLMDGGVGGGVDVKVKGLGSVQRFGAWVGGSMLAELATTSNDYNDGTWISRKDYLEYGAPTVLHRRRGSV